MTTGRSSLPALTLACFVVSCGSTASSVGRRGEERDSGPAFAVREDARFAAADSYDLGACWLADDAGTLACCGTGAPLPPALPVRAIWSGLSLWCVAYAAGGGLCSIPGADVECRLDPAITFAKVVATRSEVCGLGLDARVVCWNAQSEGHPGPHTFDLAGGVPRLELADATDLEATPYFVCALTRGDAWCWDVDDRHASSVGCCGSTPEQQTRFGDVVDLAVSGMMTVCALRRSGEVFCWDGNGNGYLPELPRGDLWLEPEPRRVEMDASLAWIRGVGVGTFCGGTTEGVVYCWGFGASALLGLGRFEWLGPDESLFRGRQVDVRAHNLGGSEHIGCVLDGETPRCRLAPGEVGEICPGGRDPIE